jgi:p-hydroxybenzoic acid efflux pump subunit AaeB
VSAIAQAGSFPFAQSSSWPIRALFSDVRVRYGIKLGLAGLLALCLTQLLPLPHDSWAILTVLVVMLSQYVGTAAVKAIMRVVGTIAGAIVGVWLVGNYTSTPIVFLAVLFVVMAHATYQFGHFGVRQFPYSYFLLGLTTLVIATDGIAAPNQVWQLGLYRTEEILAGIVSALLVSSILWPRYAREEFVTVARAALRSIEPLLLDQNRTRADGLTKVNLQEIRETFVGKLTALTNLRHAGSRENSTFSAHLPSYDAYLVSLISFFDAAFYLAEWPLTDAPIVDQLRKELEQVYRGLVEEIRILSSPGLPNERLPASSLNAAFADLDQKVEKLRAQGSLLVQPIAVGVTFSSGFAALRSLRDELNTLRGLTERLPQRGQLQPKPILSLDSPSTIDWFWVKIGVKGGLAALIGIALLMWIHPPGAASIPLMAWLQAGNGRAYLRAGGSGDRCGFQNAFLGCLILAGCTFVLLAVTPLLASYLAMNLALFFVLFGFGFATARIIGITFGMQLAFLIISAFVGLNPQQPVSSQTIIDTFVGLGIGLFIGSAVGRFLWPVLPQTVLRENLLGILADLKALLSGDPHREAVEIRLALRSVETHQIVRRIPVPARWHPKKERKLDALTTKLLALGPRVIHLTALHADLPQAAEPFLRLPLQRLKNNLIELLAAFADCIANDSTRRDLPTLDRALRETDEALRQIADQRILKSYPVRVPLLTLDIVARYRAVADALNKLRPLIADPQIHRYWGDHAL